MSIWLIAILFLAGLVLLGNLFTTWLQDYFIFRPSKLPDDYVFEFEAPYEEDFLASPQGGRINTLWFRVPPGQTARGVVLYAHGNRGSLERWGHLHYFFTRLGYDFYIYDFRGFGKSKGKRSQALMYADALAVYEEVNRHYPADRIILFGRSLGAAFAIELAAKVPARKVILETPFSSMRDLFSAYFRLLPPFFRFKYNFPNKKWLRLCPLPVYIFHGTEDLVVPYKVAKKLKAGLKTSDHFFTIKGAGHSNLVFYDLYNIKVAEILNDKI